MNNMMYLLRMHFLESSWPYKSHSAALLWSTNLCTPPLDPVGPTAVKLPFQKLLQSNCDDVELHEGKVID